MSETLLESINPFGNIQAVVESDGRACFLYLYGAPELDFGMRSVWVRNLVQAPEALDVAAMRAGEAPLNPELYCRSVSAGDALRPSELRVVWLPEGNGAALYERDEILAIVPPWSGTKGFHGYARDAVGEGPLAWELRSDNAMHQRLEQAARYWREWEGDLWVTSSEVLISQYAETLGAYSNYYAIDGGEWPPRALVRIPHQDGVVLATVGMSLLCQPNVETAFGDWALFRRIELAAYLPTSWPDEGVKQFSRYLSAQSRLPWARYTWLGSGHTIPCDSWRNPKFAAAVLTTKHPAVPTVKLGLPSAERITMLWFLPISQAERETAVSSSGQALLAGLPCDRWREA